MPSRGHISGEFAPPVSFISIIVTPAIATIRRFWAAIGRAPSPETAASAITDGGAGAVEAGTDTSVFHQRQTGVRGVSVVIPARNDGATIAPLLLRLHAAMTAADLPYEAIVINDHSSDDTAQRASAVIAEEGFPARVLETFGKPGKSSSLMEGVAVAHYSVFAMIDGSLEQPPEALPEMVRQLARYDLVIGRRAYRKGASIRERISATFSRVALRLFLGVNFDAQSGIKVFWKYVYDSLELTSGRWSFDMELVAKALADGFRVGECEAPFQERQAREGNGDPVAAAIEFIGSALKIKRELAQTSKANATLKVRSTTVAQAGMPAARRDRLYLALAEWASPLAALWAFLYVMMGQAFFSSRYFLGYPGDTNQYMWYMGWIWHALQTGKSPLVTFAFNYPGPLYLMDNTSVPALGVLFGWMYGFASVAFVYNLIVVTNYVAVFVFGKLTLRTLGVRPALSSAGGLLFCLLPYITAQDMEHLHLAFVAPLFIAGYLVTRIAVQGARPGERPGWAIGLLLGLSLVFAFYVALETFLTALLCIAVVYGCALIGAFRPASALTRNVLNVRFVAGVAAPLLLIVPGLVSYFQGESPHPFDFSASSVFYSNDVLSALVPTPLYLAHNDATTAIVSHFTGNSLEWDGYLSIPLILMGIVYAVRGWNRPIVRVLTLASTCMLIFSWGPFLHVDGVQTPIRLPWSVMRHIPFIREALPSRLGLYTAYLAVLLVVWSVNESVTRPVKLAQAQRRSPAWYAKLGVNIALLGTVAALWLPLVPNVATPMPVAARILSADKVAPRYLAHQTTLALCDKNTGFNVVMGILAASDNYDLQTSNVYTLNFENTPSYKLNLAFIYDVNGKDTAAALRQYLPQLDVGRVMFVSIDDLPISPRQEDEISATLGPPLYNDQGLVVVWRASLAS